MTKKEKQDLRDLSNITNLIYDELREHRKESAKRHEDLDARVRKVEETQGKFKGAIALLSFIGLSGIAAIFKQ